MKNKYMRLAAGLCCLVLLFTAGTLPAQPRKDSITAGNIKEMVMNRQYNFKAESVTPLAGRFRQLTSDYDLRVTKDQVISNLPYFGRAYTAPIGTSGGGIAFTSRDFDYTVTERKKGGWNVVIKYKDVPDTQVMQLSIFSNGSASLQVTSTNRQSISFNGYIAAPDKK